MYKESKLDYSLISDLQIEGIDYSDYPDFCDAYISSAYYGDRPMTEEELDILNNDGAYLHEAVWNYIH